jgi:site-specific DNA-methyltransferase (adenine-specific)
MSNIQLLLGDSREVIKGLEDNSVDSVVCDPPYAIGFMGKGWDSGDDNIANDKEFWKEVLRVLKPGGHLLSFSHSRTYHRQAVAVEDAGFEIRDQIMWIYGSGFPKSHNIGKSVDKIQGNEREVVGVSKNDRPNSQVKGGRGFDSAFNSGQEHQAIIETKGNSDWEGWGTALKPAHEPIVMARKPFKGSVAENVLEWGTGGINVDGCRIGNEVRTTPIHSTDVKEDNTLFGLHPTIQHERVETTEGRFPANIIFECTCENPKVVADKYDIRTYNDYKNTFQSYEENDKEKGKYEIKDVETTKVIHTDPNCPCYILDKQSGNKTGQRGVVKGTEPSHTKKNAIYGDYSMVEGKFAKPMDDLGGASRFFYCPKASKKDRNEGCDGLPQKANVFMSPDSRMDKEHYERTSPGMERFKTEPKSNYHPTVKPTDLMAYLIRLVTPKGGVVLDPFMGSGSMGKAAVREGMNFIGIERDDEYMEIAKSRIEHEESKNKHQQFWTL